MSSDNGAAPHSDYEDLTPPEGWPKLSDTALYGPAGDYVRTVGPHTESDPVALLSQFLAAFGNIANRAAYHTVEAARHHLNIYLVLVGRTSLARKGGSWEHVCAFYERIDSDWVRDCIIGGLSTGQGLIHHLRDPSTKENGKTDPGRKDSRCFVAESEFATVLKRCAAPDSILSQILRQGWDKGTLYNPTRNLPERATGVHVSLAGHITQDELKRYLTLTEIANGLANRIQFYLVQRQRYLPHGGHVEAAKLNSLVEQVHAALEAARNPGEFTWSPEADAVWCPLYPALTRGNRPGLAGAMLDRLAPQTLRLACIYTALDGERVISLAHLEAALALAQYYEDSVKYIFGDAIGDNDCDAIMSALRVQPAGLTRTDINNLFQHNISAARIAAALTKLMSLKLARSDFASTTGPGRKPERWFAITKTEEKQEVAQKWTV